ncbi:hypothetical protein, partial [Fulvivirga aurantia]|uniref:hypothetical protein n=1 Tax=Fulvivirga aurantia TaxID=2529383 RepID=UPI001627B209
GGSSQGPGEAIGTPLGIGLEGDSDGGGNNSNSVDIIGFENLPTTDEERLSYLENQLNEDEFALFNQEEIDCMQLRKWKNVRSTNIPYSVKERIEVLNQENKELSFAWDLQGINDGFGIAVNLDCFSVDVQLPLGTTPQEFLEYMRLNFFDNLGNTAEFYPHPDLPGEGERWQNPQTALGSILSISMIDDDSVICINRSSTSWTFLTIKDPRNWRHPVAGFRRFGFTNNGDGTYNFYTRGVDRIRGPAQTLVREVGMLANADILDEANNVWTALQQKIKNYTEDIGGIANIRNPVIVRPNYQEYKEVLNGNRPYVSGVNCN